MAKTKDEGPDLPGVWAAYGVLLQFLRKRSGLNQQQLGDAIGYSLEQVASVEQGRRPAKAAFTVAADRVLEAGGVLEALQEQVDRAKLPRFFRNFALIEAEAVSRFDYEPLLVPGLLQTEEYVRAVYAGHRPRWEPDAVENHTEARLNRQKILTRTPAVDLSFVIAQEALTNSVGGREVMRNQLHHLLTVGELDNVQIQIMPPARGFHLGLNGAFVVVETMEHRRYGYVESQGIGLVADEAGAVSHLGLRYGMLRSQALNTEQSARLIERLAGETAA
ncbi:helix-turn-helix domain-containing protein [Streptomyces sp. NPDC087437]|uniref:helix-turn-helix domain-containing protein n=1 Tax=Streptomyces sp. NPDC087437 TaxID=3365789 RepID=UPI003828694A